MDLLLETVTGPAGSVRVRAYPEGDALAVEVSVVGGPVVGTFALHDDDEALTGLLNLRGENPRPGELFYVRGLKGVLGGEDSSGGIER